MSESEEQKCEICHGPHATYMHYNWVEMPLEMPEKDIREELEKYADILKEMKIGGIIAVEKALEKSGIPLKKDACFCGTSNHTSADHLRWLLDKENELKN